MESEEKYKMKAQDRGIIACCKTILHSEDKELYKKMRLAVDCFMEQENKGFEDQSHDRELLMSGAALMYHVMTKPYFLKQETENLPK